MRAMAPKISLKSRCYRPKKNDFGQALEFHVGKSCVIVIYDECSALIIDAERR